MKIESQYKTFSEIQNIVKYRNFLNKNKISLVYPRSKLKIGLGLACLVIAVIPNGLFIPASLLGCCLLGIGKNDLLSYIENLKFKLMGF